MAKILIIDDDPMIVLMYQKILVNEGFEVETAADGEEGLAKAMSINPTLIMTDVMMPKMNGLQVLDALKANEKTKSIPVVMLTNLTDEQDAKAALSKGAVKYMGKSEYEPKQVGEIVKEILANFSTPQTPNPAPQPTQ